MAAGELVQLARAGDFVVHFRKLRLTADRVSEGLGLHHKFRVFDLVQRTSAIGELNTALKCAVALPCNRKLPLACHYAQALDAERLAAGTAGAGHGRQGGFARHHRLQRNRRHRVDQRIEPRFFLG